MNQWRPTGGRKPGQPAPFDAGLPARSAERMDRDFGVPCVFIDFEFNQSAEPVVNLVSCSLSVSRPWGFCSAHEIREYWLHNDPNMRSTLATDLQQLVNEKAIFVGYATAAEARSCLALGLDPHAMRWVDLYAEWRQLTFNNNDCQYGTYYTTTGFKRFSVPPHFEKARNKGRDNNEVGVGLVACAGQLFGLFIDSERKRTMRDLIIENRPSYTPAERAEIMAYCSDDVKYLSAIWAEQFTRLLLATGLPAATLLAVQERRGEFSSSVAKMEQLGFPLVLDAVRSLRRNFAAAQNELIEDLVQNQYPFYVRQKKRASQLVGDWTDKYSAFEDFLRERGLLEKWPRTVDENTGRTTETLSRDDKVLGKYDGVPELRAYRQVKKQVNQLRWFKEPDSSKLARDGDFFDSVGSDGRLRTFLGPFGTQTSRNAPKASRFILAMSSWLRCLIMAPPGWVIISVDYSSQEFGIAAVLSNDPAMMAAYESGDPYLYFAKRAGAVPEDARPDWVKDPDKAPIQTVREDGTVEETRKNYEAYKFQRGLFKATTLGLQYGMGAEKLAIKLGIDMGRPFTREEAERLLALHKKVYPVYWRWLETVEAEYKRRGRLLLWDGWALLGDNENSLSVRNFPTQGGGGATMREAVRRGHAQGLHILAPLHDALYSMAREEDKEPATAALCDCMTQAVHAVIGERLKIRLDVEVHEHGHPWIEDKGRKHYQLLKKYLEPMDTLEDRQERILSRCFK